MAEESGLHQHPTTRNNQITVSLLAAEAGALRPRHAAIVTPYSGRTLFCPFLYMHSLSRHVLRSQGRICLVSEEALSARQRSLLRNAKKPSSERKEASFGTAVVLISAVIA